ncbi:MAG: hypothetical protein JWL61_3161 [Gemmatimonadetes bacterium]|nr:hypothetical protein [Gemmatimonadota bacterium]
MTSDNNKSSEKEKNAAPSDQIQDLSDDIGADAAEKVKGGFNPVPEPPGKIRGFDPQPDPPIFRTPKQGY